MYGEMFVWGINITNGSMDPQKHIVCFCTLCMLVGYSGPMLNFGTPQNVPDCNFLGDFYLYTLKLLILQFCPPKSG